MLLLPRQHVVNGDDRVGVLRGAASMEMTASGAKNLSAGSLSAVGAPATKCAGASMCVPVCSSNVISLAKKPSFAIENFGLI